MNTSDQLNKCYSLLRRYDTAVIATASPGSEPHASVVNYFMDHSMDLFFLARENAQKFKNLTDNPRTSLVVCTPNFGSSVEIEGVSYLLEDSPKVNDMLIKYAKVIKHKNAGPLPIMRHTGSELYLFRLVPHMMTYADFNLSGNDEGDYFEIYLRNQNPD